jgi:tetratricopeptide (TPR) repeat protein
MSKPLWYRTITRRMLQAHALAALTLAALTGTCCLHAQTSGDAASTTPVKKPAPTFRASGIQGTIAPSGYSDGATEQHARQVASLVLDLQAANYAEQWPSTEKLSCDREAALLHASLVQPDSFQANRRLGLFYLQHGRPDLGAKYLGIAKTSHPADSEVVRDLAMADMEARDYSAAGQLAGELTELDPQDAFAHQVKGAVEAAAGHPEAALEEYKLSARLDSSPANVFSAGLSIIALGFFADAEQLFAAATTRHHDSARLWLGMGIVDILQARQAQAVDSLLRSAALDPGNGLTPTLLATLMANAEDNIRIFPVIQAFASAHPKQAIAHYDYALALSRAHPPGLDGRREKQLEAELKLAVFEQPDFAAAHFQLGIMYQEEADLPSAIQEFLQAVSLQPDVAEWRYRLARAYHQAGQTESAELEMTKFKQLAAQRDAGKDVSARLLDGLPPELLGTDAEPCDASH